MGRLAGAFVIDVARRNATSSVDWLWPNDRVETGGSTKLRGTHIGSGVSLLIAPGTLNPGS